MAEINTGRVIALFAFDIGFEVSLEKLSSLATAGPIQPLSNKKQTPAYLQYTKPPWVVNVAQLDPLVAEPGRVQITVFDFGAASVAYHWPLKPLASTAAPVQVEDLPQLGQTLLGRNLEAQARKQVQRLMDLIGPAITRPELSNLVEDYYLFVIEDVEGIDHSDDLLRRFAPTLAQVLRFEIQPLSREQQDEALSQRISYFENDLVILDWNSAIIYDRDYYDTSTVLELLNVELLEARYMDAQLDRRIGEYQGLVMKRRRSLLPLRNPYRKERQELSELRFEALLLSERIDNVLKLIGDLYLARVHALAAKRFYLQDWETAISKKLEIIDDFYELLNDRVRTRQSQTLELVVIALILVEILLAIFAHWH